MKTRILLYCLIPTAWLPSAVAGGSSKWTPPPGQVDMRPADEIAWDQLQLQMRATKEPGAETTSPQPEFKLLAQLANAYQTKFPNSPKGLQAKALELQNLLNTALAGDDAGSVRAVALLADLRGEKKLDVELRCELVRLSYIVANRHLTVGTDEQLAATEAAARNLIAEFPAHRAGYESLFQLVGVSSGDKGASLAAELTRIAPMADIQQAAKLVLDRHALIGQRLSQIAQRVLEDVNPFGEIKNKAVIIYAWASWSSGQIALLRNLNELAPSNVAFVGINLDEDVATARATAAAANLPGIQLYDPRGQQAPLVQALKLGLDLPIYVASSHGEIREVTAGKGDTRAKIAAALQ